MAKMPENSQAQSSNKSKQRFPALTPEQKAEVLAKVPEDLRRIKAIKSEPVPGVDVRPPEVPDDGKGPGLMRRVKKQ